MTAHRALFALVALLAIAAPAAAGARAAAAGARAPVLALSGWDAIGADFSGTGLVYGASAGVRLPRFSYQRTDVYRVPVSPAGRLRGRPEDLVVVRTSAGRMTAASVAGAGDGRFVVTVRGRGFAPPVIWCCDDSDVQSVIESDGRADAPVALAAAQDGARVRFLLAPGAGVVGAGFRLVSADPSLAPGLDRREAPFPYAAGLAALAPGIVAWADPPLAVGGLGAAMVGVGVPTDSGVEDVRTLPQPGPVVGVWAAAGTVVAAARAARGVEVARYDLPALRRRVLWRGSSLPTVAVGGGTVALADGRRLLAGRGALRLVRRAAGPVAALAVSPRLLASFERVAAPARPGAPPRSTRVWLTRLA